MSSAMSLFSMEAGGGREDLDEALGIIVTAHPSYKFTCLHSTVKRMEVSLAC